MLALIVPLVQAVLWNQNTLKPLCSPKDNNRCCSLKLLPLQVVLYCVDQTQLYLHQNNWKEHTYVPIYTNHIHSTCICGIYTHTCAHADTHIHIYTAHVHAHMHKYTHRYTHVHTFIHTYIGTKTCTTHTHTHTYIQYVIMCTQVHIHVH